MFSFFSKGRSKKEPQKLEINDEFSSKVASAFEDFLISRASDWENPSENIKDYTLRIYPHGSMSFRLNSIESKNDDAVFTVPFNQIKKSDFLDSSTIESIRPGPFVNPFISMIADEIIEHIREQEAQKTYEP